MVTRCQFANTPEMIAYHDEEWGQVKNTSQEVFEALCLESMQAGLSWAIILNKRSALKDAYAQFDMVQLAAFDAQDVERLMGNPEIIRHRLKIEAMISNARVALEIEQDPDQPNFRDFIYLLAQHLLEKFDGDEGVINKELAKLLKKQGFKFVGPTIAESFLEAIGVYNHHDDACFLK